MPALRLPVTQVPATGANAAQGAAFAIQVSSPSAKALDRYLIGLVDLRIKVQPRVVWVERWALI